MVTEKIRSLIRSENDDFDSDDYIESEIIAGNIIRAIAGWELGGYIAIKINQKLGLHLR